MVIDSESNTYTDINSHTNCPGCNQLLTLLFLDFSLKLNINTHCLKNVIGFAITLYSRKIIP